MVASKNSALAVETKTVEGGYVDLQITEYGRLVWLRVSSNTKLNMVAQTEYNVFQIGQKPRYSIYRRIYISDQNGFIFKVSTDGGVSITPFGDNISPGTGINVSELYITTN